MLLRRVSAPWAVGAVAGVVAIALLGVGLLRPPGRLDVFLEPAGAEGPDPFLVLDSPDLRVGEAEELALGSGVAVRVGIEPGLYGGSGSDHLCDPQLIADFLAQDQAKATAWASAAGIEVDQIEPFLDTLTPVRLLADTWVTNHGYRDGKATPRQSILQAGSMVLVDDLGVPRVRCKCGNPLQPPQIPDDLDQVDLVGEPWDGFDLARVLSVEPGFAPVEWFVLTRLEDARTIARPVATLGDQDVLVDEDGQWIPELDLDLPPRAAVGDGPFRLPPTTSGDVEVSYRVAGPCRIVGDELVLEGEGQCVLSIRSGAEPPWGPLEVDLELLVGRLDQTISIGDIGTIVLGEGPVPLAAVADSLLPVEYEVAGPCEIDGDDLVPTGVGQCELTITQPGDARWSPAEPVVITLEISDGPARQPVTISFDLPPSIRLGDEPLPLDATTSPNRPVTYLVAGACSAGPSDTLVADTIGACEVQAVAADNEQFQRAVAGDTLTVLPRLQTLGLDAVPRSAVLSSAPIPLPATTSAGIDISYEAIGDCRITPQGLLLTTIGRCELVASADGDLETEPATERVVITITSSAVARLSQTITFDRPGALVHGGSGVALSATASSGLPVALTVTEGDCSLSGTTLTPGSAGRCTIVASQNGDAEHEPAPSVTRTVTVAKLTPTLNTSVTGGSVSEMLEGESRTVTGATSAGPDPAITATTGPCTVSGSSVTAMSTAGDCVVTVAAAGDANHNPVSATVTIAVKLRQSVTVTVGSTSMQVDGQQTVNASASSGLAVSVSVGPSSVCIFTTGGSGTGAGIVTAVGAGTCTITGNQGGNGSYAPASDSVSVQVSGREVPVITIKAPSSLAVGSEAQITATSTAPQVAISFDVTGGACTLQGNGLVVGVSRGTCTVEASHPATPGFEAGSAEVSLPVVGLADLVRFDCIGPCDIGIGEQLAVAVVADSGLPTNASVTGPCTLVGQQGNDVAIRGDGAGTCTLTASTAGDATWEPATGSLQFTVSGETATVSFSLGGPLFVGDERSIGIQHTIPLRLVKASIASSEACQAAIRADGTAATVVAVNVGTCSVTVTVSGGNQSASHTDQARVTFQ